MLDLRIWLLGGFRLDVGRRELADEEWRPRKATSLVKLLALTPGHRLHREQVLDVLWPEFGAEAGDNPLRKVLHAARRTLDPDPAEAYHYRESGEQLGLCQAVAWGDVEAFEDAALQARRTGDPTAYRQASALYGGDLLPEDRYAEWAIERAEALRAEYLALLVGLGRLLEARADFDEAAALLRTAVGIDPLYEDTTVALMRAYALAGRRHEALAGYRRLRAAKERESVGSPGAATERLYEQIRTGQVVQPELTSDLWEQVGDLRTLSGDTAGAAAAYTCALDAAGRGPRDLTAVALHRKAATAYLQQHDSEAARLRLQVAEKWPGAAAADRAEAGRMRAVRANWLWEIGRYAEAQQAAEASRDAAERYGTSENVAAADEQLAIVHHRRGNWREGLHSELEPLGAGADTALARISTSTAASGSTTCTATASATASSSTPGARWIWHCRGARAGPRRSRGACSVRRSCCRAAGTRPQTAWSAVRRSTTNSATGAARCPGSGWQNSSLAAATARRWRGSCGGPCSPVHGRRGTRGSWARQPPPLRRSGPSGRCTRS